MKYLLKVIFFLILAGNATAQLPASKLAPSLRQLPQVDSLTISLVVQDVNAFQYPILQSYPDAGILVIRTTPAFILDSLLPRPDVWFIDQAFETGNPEVIIPGHNLVVNNISYVHNRQPDLNGFGTTLSVKEFGFNKMDVDLRNRVLLQENTEIDPHATFMASTAAGAGNSGRPARGAARGAKLVSSAYTSLLPNPDEHYEDWDISIQNHSYGIDVQNYYGANALAYDVNTQAFPELLHVFSAGNAGQDGWSSLTGNFKMAKNVLTVGSTDSFGLVMPFSSRGPAYDGRIKPDLVAYGPDGTSGAAALVSGSAAVLRQAWRDRFSSWPSGAMLRSILIVSCEDTGAAGPDYTAGFGSLNLKNAVQIIDEFPVFQAEAEPGQLLAFDLQIPAQVNQLRIALAWTDPPAAINASKALVNDLNLALTDPEGNIWLPWALNPSLPDQPAERGLDSLNNLELISIDLPLSGIYTLAVSGGNSTQPFALAVFWDTLGQVEWTFPLRGDPVHPDSEATLRWETSVEDSLGALFWKPAGASSWLLVDDSVQLAAEHFEWASPDTFTLAQLRLQTGIAEFISDTFLIAAEPTLEVAANCADTLLLSWPAVASEATYQIWGLGSRYLLPLFQTTDTLVYLSKNDFPYQRFALQVLDGPLSLAPDINLQGAGCYVNGLYGNVEGQIISGGIQLGTLLGVEEVLLEKWIGGQWQTLLTYFPNDLFLPWEDMTAQAGPNLYRAAARLQSGIRHFSDELTVYYAGERGIFVYPNPVMGSEWLTVLTEASAESTTLLIYDAAGRLTGQYILDDSPYLIPVAALPSGLFFWQLINQEGKKISVGKGIRP